MLRTSIIAAVSALALAGCGQQAQQAEAPPVSEPLAPAAPTVAQISDADFVQQVANSDAFEVQAAEIAVQRGVRADVKDLARMLRTDHTATTQELTTLAPTINLAAPSPMVDGELATRLEALRNASGEAFDDLYLDQQVEAHENAIRTFQAYVSGAPQGALRQWAENTLPKLRTHLERTQTLENAT
jgi:putative membrane protein